MATKSLRHIWIPYLVIVIGFTISFGIWYYFFYDLTAYFHFLQAIGRNIAWLALGIGAAISILLGAVIRATQVAQQRALILGEVNANLVKEIHERTAIEESKQKLEVALLQGQKLQAMGTLAGGIAHDFNNILYAIIGYTEMCRQDVEKDSITYTNLGKVLDASCRGRELVSRILAFSRRQHHQVEEIDLQQTIEAALALLRPTIPAGVMINFNAESHPTILGNQTQLHQVLVNIINNAVDAMDSEGTIDIHLSDIHQDDPLLRQFPSTRMQSYCKIDIIDTGHGMDQSTIERMFEPFFTTKEVGKGTGLGLSIVHTIIKDHRGEITVNSQLGHGTRFMILLPKHVSN